MADNPVDNKPVDILAAAAGVPTPAQVKSLWRYRKLALILGGAGAIDSKIVAFRATPGEMVNVRKNTFAGNSGDGGVIHIQLQHDEAFVSGVADQVVQTRSGQIVRVSVDQSVKAVRRNFSNMATETNARVA